jgi:WD40 repeat protein
MSDHSSSTLRMAHQWAAHEKWISTLAFSPLGDFLVSASWDTSVKLWKTGTWDLISKLEGHTKSVNSVAFHPAGNIVASGADDRMIAIWDLKSCTQKHAFQAHQRLGVDSLSFSPDGALLAAAFADGTASIYKTSDWSMFLTLKGYDFKAGIPVITGSVAVFSPAGSVLASTEQGENSVKIWNVENGELLGKLGGHSSKVESISFSPDGRTLACALRDSRVHIYDVNQAACALVLGTERVDIIPSTGGKVYRHQLNSVAFSHDNALLAAAGWDKEILTWTSPQWVEANKLEGLDEKVNSLAFSPQGKYLASGLANGSICIVEV